MTRRGSVAYYLAALVVGCTLMTLALWLPHGSPGTHWTPDTRGAAGLLFLCFIGFMLGTPSALLFGFLLRRAAAFWPGSVWHWVFAGALLAPAEMWLLGKLAEQLRPLGGQADALARPLFFLLMGPAMVSESGRLWTVLPVGAATAFVLYRIERAFDPGTGRV